MWDIALKWIVIVYLSIISVLSGFDEASIEIHRIVWATDDFHFEKLILLNWYRACDTTSPELDQHSVTKAGAAHGQNANKLITQFPFFVRHSFVYEYRCEHIGHDNLCA